MKRRVDDVGALFGEVYACTSVPEAYAALVAEALSAKAGRFVLGASGSGSGKACLGALVAAGLALRRVALFLVDERDVPPDHPDANVKMFRETLGARLDELAAFVPLDPALGPEAASAALAPLFPPDLVQLGMGADGHTASLFPRSVRLDADPAALVVWNEDPDGNNHYRRLSLTLPAIATAHTAVLTVVGTEKADALRALRAGADLPAARVRAKQVVWLVDDAAWTAAGG